MKIKVESTTQRELVKLSLIVKPVPSKPSAADVRRESWGR